MGEHGTPTSRAGRRTTCSSGCAGSRANPGPAADGRGGHLLHRHPDRGVGDDEGPRGPSPSGSSTSTSPTASRTPSRPAKALTRSSPGEPGDRATRALLNHPSLVRRQITMRHHQHLDRHRHDLRALRRERHRGDHRDRRCRGRKVDVPTGQVTVTSAAPLDAAAVKAAVEEPATSWHERAATGGEVELAITGMTCASCANRIERKAQQGRGVTATVNYATSEAKVTYGRIHPEDLVATVEQAGVCRCPPSLPPPRTRRAADPHEVAVADCANASSSRPCCRCRSSRGDGPRSSSPTGSGCRSPSPPGGRLGTLPFHRAWTSLTARRDHDGHAHLDGHPRGLLLVALCPLPRPRREPGMSTPSS